MICIAIMYSAAAFNGVNGMLFTVASNAVISLILIAYGKAALISKLKTTYAVQPNEENDV